MSRAAIGIFPAVINPHFPATTLEQKAEYASRVRKLKTYLKFNPDEAVLAMGNASVARLHGGRVIAAVGQMSMFRAQGVRELVIGEVVPELAR